MEIAGTARICLLDNAGQQHNKWGSDNYLQEGGSHVVTKDISRLVRAEIITNQLPIVQRDAVEQCKKCCKLAMKFWAIVIMKMH